MSKRGGLGMLYIGGIIVIATFVAIIKKFETRLCLMMGGFIMALIAMKPMMAVDGFVKTMTSSLVVTVCSIMGFAYIMKMTNCNEHMTKVLTKLLKKIPWFLIPGTIIGTWLCNIPLTSAAGCSAAVGSILIPTLIKSGVHPNMAASVVFAGTWGGAISPGNTHVNYLAKLASEANLQDSTIMDVCVVHALPAEAALVLVVIGITLTARLFKEESGYVDASGKIVQEEEPVFKINPLMAITPVLPLALLILSAKQIHLLPKVFQSIPLDMLLGSAIGALVTRTNPEEVIKDFWRGAGDAYGKVMGLIISAFVFTSGMSAIGLTGALINLMKHSQGAAKLAAGFGTFSLAFLAGSADASTLAFNSSITPHATEFGLGLVQLGTLAHLTGVLGRSCSPVAAACIVCAGIAGVSPIEIAKRNLGVMFLGACLIMVML